MKIYCNVCNNYRKLEKKLKCHIYFEKTLSLSIVYSQCGDGHIKIIKEEESIEILTILGLINDIEEYQKIYGHARIKHESKISIEKNRWNMRLLNWSLMSKNHKNVCRVLNYIEHSLILISTITGCASISAFTSLVSIPLGITSSTIGLKFFIITTGIKKYKSINKKNKKKHIKIVLLAKYKFPNWIP